MQTRCPRCAHPLVREVRGTIEVDTCPTCGGTWFDRGEIEVAVAEAAAPTVATATVESGIRYLPCPRCGAPMARCNWERFSGVVVDRCTAHGVWADRGELERIVAFEASGGKQRRARKEAEELRLDRQREARRDANWARIQIRMRGI